ncbi:hypothetical protein JOM56_013255 [Amanita muscaria]
MDDLDIQTAQLIIQLARDDLYQLDDNASSGNNQDVSDLELALAEQEREFMEHWTGYGGTQIKQNVGGPSRQAGSGNGSNVGDSAVARSSTGPIRRAGSPQLRPVTPINPIDDYDDYDDDDMYVNPYEPTSAASSSSDDPEPASRAAHEPHQLQVVAAASSELLLPRSLVQHCPTTMAHIPILLPWNNSWNRDSLYFISFDCLSTFLPFLQFVASSSSLYPFPLRFVLLLCSRSLFSFLPSRSPHSSSTSVSPFLLHTQ